MDNVQAQHTKEEIDRFSKAIAHLKVEAVQLSQNGWADLAEITKSKIKKVQRRIDGLAKKLEEA